MVNKKIVIICTIIAIGIITAIVGVNIVKWNEHYYVELENQNNVNMTEKDVIGLNTITENNTSEENTESESYNQVLGEEEQQVEEPTNTDKSEEAISLAKKEWGENDETVYYTVDNSSGNIYTISVRSKSTTSQLAEYEVDMSNKKVTIK